jgi:hypothetical protein
MANNVETFPITHSTFFLHKKPVVLSRAKIGIIVFRDLKFLNV